MLNVRQECARDMAATVEEKNRAGLAAEKQIAELMEARDEMRTKLIRMQKQMAQSSGHESDSECSSDAGTLTLNTTTVSGSGNDLVTEEKRKLSKKYKRKVARISRVSKLVSTVLIVKIDVM